MTYAMREEIFSKEYLSIKDMQELLWHEVRYYLKEMTKRARRFQMSGRRA